MEPILTNCLPPDCDTSISLIDSMPIITCSAKRSTKVAREITDIPTENLSKEQIINALKKEQKEDRFFSI